MSIFKGGKAGGGVPVERPAWPRFSRTELSMVEREEMEVAAASFAQSAALQPAAEDVLRQARLEAAQILQEAASEAESAVNAARQEGFEAGLQEGMAAAQSETDGTRAEAREELAKAREEAESIRTGAAEQVAGLMAEAEARIQAMLAQAQEQAEALLAEAYQEQARRLDIAREALADLAVAAAMRLVQGQLAVSPESVVAMVAAGLSKLKDTHCTVRVSPADLPLLEAERPLLERELATGTLQVQPDKGLQPGSFLISSPSGQIDGRLEKQEEALESALQGELGGDGS